MEDLNLTICKICKKVFADAQGLAKHKMAQHPQKHQSSIQIQATNNIKDNLVTHQFRNNSNISITRIHKETNSARVAPSSMNQNSFRKTSVASPSITMRRQEMKSKQAEGSRVKPPFRSPDGRIKGAQTSVKSMVMGGRVSDDETTDRWQKWEPPVSKDRDNMAQRPAPSTATGKPSGGAIISQYAAEVAASATTTTARKSVPQLHPLQVPGGAKRPVPGTKVTSAPGGARGGTATSAVQDIMQNLGKIKSMNMNQQRTVVAKPKLISVPQTKKGFIPVVNTVSHPAVQKQPAQQAFRANKPPPAPKNKPKILPGNSAGGNALPKAGGQAAKKVLIEEMEADSSDEQDEETDTELDLGPFVPQQQATKNVSLAKGKASSAGGKAPPPSKSLNTNRFNPIESPKKGKGKAAAAGATTTTSPKGSPNGKSKVGAASAASTSSVTNGTNKQSAASSSSVVAKKSVPPAEAKGKKKKAKTDRVSKLKALVPTMAGTDYDMPKLSAIGSYTNRAGQQVWVCLVCNEKEHEESSRDMICCEMCDDWYHMECVGIRQTPEEEEDWYCKRCIYQVVPNAKKVFPRIFRDDLLD